MCGALVTLLCWAGSGAAQPPASTGDSVALSQLAPGTLHPTIVATSDPTQSFALYLPESFSTERRWPLLLVFDPRARGKLAAEIFVPAAERLGWIVASSNNTMSDGPFEPNAKAVNAMVPDLLNGLPIDLRRVYASGFSGGAIVAWILGASTGQLTGVISVGGRPPDGALQKPPSFAVWLAAGDSDFNYRPSLELDAIAAEARVPHRFEPFAGPHSWFSNQDAGRAMDWLAILAMRDGSAPRDEPWIDAQLRAERERIDEQMASGDVLAALRTLQATVGTYDGLRDVSALEQQLGQLETSAELARARREDRRAERYEDSGRRRLAQAVAELRASEPVMAVAKLRARVGVASLQHDAQQGGALGGAAQRVLASAETQLGFYVMRELFARGDYTRAAVALAIAVEVREDNATAWYNLACALARTHHRTDALEALSHAQELGFFNAPRALEQLRTDADLEALHDEPGFRALLGQVEQGQGTLERTTEVDGN